MSTKYLDCAMQIISLGTSDKSNVNNLNYLPGLSARGPDPSKTDTLSSSAVFL